jgi:hypothetical protein
MVADDDRVHWQQAPTLTIRRDDQGNAWHAGRVTALLRLRAPGTSDLIVATPNGGVFRVNVNGDATPLSDDWDKPEIFALYPGPHGAWHMYAAGRGLYVADPVQPNDQGPKVWHDITYPPIGYISDVCTTDNSFLLLTSYSGLWVSAIPPQGNPAAYSFTQVTALASEHCHSVAAGVNGGFALGMFGTTSVKGLRVGTVSAGGVTVSPTGLAKGGVDPSEAMGDWLVRSWEGDRRRMYAIGGDAGDRLGSIYRSSDGGQNWTACSSVTDRPAMNVNQFGGGGAGVRGYNQAIAMGPASADTVYVGWRSEVPLVSVDAGRNWTVPAVYAGPGNLGTARPHVHWDMHALLCDPDDQTGHTVWIGSDGGVALTRDACQTFYSAVNRGLYNLQFQANPPYVFEGACGVDYHHDGVVAGGLQDNGDVTSTLFTSQTGWRQVVEGDGFRTVFLRTGTLLYSSNSDPSGVQRGSYKSPGEFSGNGTIPAKAGGTQLPNGLWDTASGPNTVFEIVNDPRVEADGRMTFAVGAANAALFVLMGDQGGNNLVWEQLKPLPLQTGDHVRAVASGSGAYIFVGSDQGEIFILDRDGNSLKRPGLLNVDSRPDDRLRASITRFLIQDDNPAHPVVLAAGGNRVLQYADGPAKPPFGGGFYVLGHGPGVAAGSGLPDPATPELGLIRALDTDWLHHPKPIYLAFDQSVWVSYDDANTWQRCNIGLPKAPYVADLRFVSQSTGEHWLYVFSFARALWRAKVA